jgi:hypothetical protein
MFAFEFPSMDSTQRWCVLGLIVQYLPLCSGRSGKGRSNLRKPTLEKIIFRDTSSAANMLMNIQGGIAQVPAREELYLCFCCNAGWVRCARALPPRQQRTDSSTVATRKWNHAGMLSGQLKSTRVRCNWCQPQRQRILAHAWRGPQE